MNKNELQAPLLYIIVIQTLELENTKVKLRMVTDGLRIRAWESPCHLSVSRHAVSVTCHIMGGRQWTTSAQADFLTSQMPDYLTAQKTERYDKFWATLNHQWFINFPEVPVLPARDPSLATLTADEEKSLLDELKATAIKKRKNVCFITIIIFNWRELTFPAFTATEDLDALAV
jgi:hypothetical protein